MSSRDFLSVPCNLKQANNAIRAWHRHHSPINDALFCVAVADPDGIVRGVAVVGRPCTNALEDGWTCEVRRVATDGTRNACSKVLALARRTAFILGYKKVQTYTMRAEGGASLRGAGWDPEKETDGKSNFSSGRTKPHGNNPHRPRRARVVGKTAQEDRQRQQGTKVRWAVTSDDERPLLVSWPQLPDDNHPTLFETFG